MKALLLAALIVLPSFASAASEDWTLFCGDAKTLGDFVEREHGQRPTNEELAELNESRLPMLNILLKGKKGIQDILDEGDRSDTGPFGAIIACGLIDKIKTEIRSNGCFNLKTNKAVKDKGGIKACEELLSQLPQSEEE